jgi:serine/threonine-protein kinase
MAPTVTLGQPAGQGYLQVNSRPWAEVIIDGRRVGNTPVVRIALAPGAHFVTLVSPSTGTRRTQRVQIRAGETTRLMVDLQSYP